jgi:hypothetical protein
VTVENAPVYGRGGWIGLIVPANNSVIEPEFWSVLPPDVAIYATRVMAKGDRRSRQSGHGGGCRRRRCGDPGGQWRAQ